jgi:transcriptional regulator with XRE-family HTH domain
MTKHDTLASRLTQRRAEMGYTQDALAKLAGIAPAQISRYESGVNKPRAKIIAKLAEVLSVPYAWLASGDETNFSTNSPKDEGEVDYWLDFPPEIHDFIERISEEKRITFQEAVIYILSKYDEFMKNSDKSDKNEDENEKSP